MSHVYATNSRVPQINKESLIIEFSPGEMIKAEYIKDQYGNVKKVDLFGEVLLDIIIEYCKYTSIPLPFNSQKVVKVFDGGLCFVVAKDISVENIHKIHELIGY
jgi:hypothetical protein